MVHIHVPLAVFVVGDVIALFSEDEFELIEVVPILIGGAIPC